MKTNITARSFRGIPVIALALAVASISTPSASAAVPTDGFDSGSGATTFDQLAQSVAVGQWQITESHASLGSGRSVASVNSNSSFSDSTTGYSGACAATYLNTKDAGGTTSATVSFFDNTGITVAAGDIISVNYYYKGNWGGASMPLSVSLVDGATELNLDSFNVSGVSSWTSRTTSEVTIDTAGTYHVKFVVSSTANDSSKEGQVYLDSVGYNKPVTSGTSDVNSTVTASLSPLTADGTTSTITVTLLDAGMNPVADKDVSLVSNRGVADAISAASGPSDASGIVTFTVSSTTAGTPVFTATDITDVVTLNNTASVTFEAGPVVAANSTVIASPTTVAADGVATSTITVTLNDTYNNPVAGKDVSLASSGGTDTISGASGPSNTSGVVTFTVSSTTAGSSVFTATDITDDNLEINPSTATVNFVHVTAVTWAETLLDVSTNATGIEIANDGTRVRAYHFGNAEAITDVTVHGVLFTNGGSADNGLTDTAMGGTWVGGWSPWNGDWSLASITDPDCNQLISSMIMATSSSTITIGGLTVGHTYRLQLISNNPRHGQIGVEGATHTLSGGDNANPVLLAATWVADDDTLNMSMLNNDMHFNAYALHDLSGGAVPDYTTWLGEYTFAEGADTTPTGDPDGDGLSNQQEYAFGLDPTSGSSVSPITQQLDKTSGTFKYTRRKTSGLTYIYQWSTTLSEPWNDFTPVTNPPAAASLSATVEGVTIEVPAAQLENSNLFLRVKAE